MIGCVSPITDGHADRCMGMDPPATARRSAAASASCPQQDTLDVELTVRENLIIYGRYFGLDRARGRAPGRRAARVRPAHRARQGPGRAAVGRDEAAPDDRPVAHQRARDAAPRRTDDRPRPAGAPPAVGSAVPAQAARRDARPDDPLHGRGGAAVRPARRHGQGQDRGRGQPARAHRAVLDPRGDRAALPARRRRGRSTAGSTASPSGSSTCPIASCCTPTTARRPRSPSISAASSPRPSSSAGRRSRTSSCA